MHVCPRLLTIELARSCAGRRKGGRWKGHAQHVGNIVHVSKNSQDANQARSGAEEGWKMEGSCTVYRPDSTRSPKIVKRPPRRGAVRGGGREEVGRVMSSR